MTRDQISKEAYAIRTVLVNLANAAWNTPRESALWSLVGVGEKLANDACEMRHTKKQLLKRLDQYRKAAKL